MKVAVINFSGNVGKTTIARHLLKPRIAGAELIAVESINADEGQATAMRGDQFGELQEYLQTVDNVVVDIGASNVEDLLALMRKYRGSHEDFDSSRTPSPPWPSWPRSASLPRRSGLSSTKSKTTPMCRGRSTRCST